MALLYVNGIRVKIAYGGRQSYDWAGTRKRTLDGTLMRDVRAIKRTWRFETPPLSQAEAEGLIALINGQGQHFSFDSNAVADSGLSPSAGATGAIYLGTAGVDGDNQKLVGTPPATTGSVRALGAAIWCTEATDDEVAAKDGNILTSDVSSAENAVSDYNAISGATLAINTSHYWQGSKSLQTTDDGTGDDGFEGNSSAAGSAQNGDKITVSCWAKSLSGSCTVNLSAVGRDSGDTSETEASSSTAFTLVENEWRWLHITVTLGNASTSRARLRLVTSTANADWVTDGMQIAHTDSLTPWVIGGTSHGGVAPQYSSPLSAGAKSCTILAWLNGSANAGAGNDGEAWRIGYAGNNHWRLYFAATTQSPVLSYISSGSQVIVSTASAQTFGTIGHFAATLNSETGAQKLYRNGALEDTDTIVDTGNLWALADTTYLYVGGQLGLYLNGFVDQLIVVPQELTAGQIAEVYNSGTPQATSIPKLTCTGDFAPDSSVTCMGEVTDARYRPLTLNGTHADNVVTVEFTLREV